MTLIKRMKKFNVAVLFILAAAVLTSCVHTPDSTMKAESSPVLKRILQRGELIVGTSGNQPPFNMTTKKGEIIGLEADLAKQMAGSMDVQLRLTAMPFSELLPALEAGKLDLIMSGMTITPKRNLKAAFVGPYFISGKGVLTKDETLASITDTSEMDSPDITLAALRGSTSQLFVERNIPKAKLILTKNYDDAVDMVIQDKVDAFVADYPICAVSVLRYPDKGLISLAAPLTYEGIGIAMPPNDPLLINWVENFLDLLEGTGLLEKMRIRWFERTDWLKKLP